MWLKQLDLLAMTNVGLLMKVIVVPELKPVIVHGTVIGYTIQGSGRVQSNNFHSIKLHRETEHMVLHVGDSLCTATLKC